MINRFIVVSVLLLPLVLGCSADTSPITTASHNENPLVSANNSAAVEESHVDGQSIKNESSKTINCDDPKGYSVQEGIKPGTHPVNIVREGIVLHTIELPTGVDVNGFGFNWVKKTKEGFEISIEYGSRFYYEKRFIFICRQHRFYLSKIRVASFDKNNPEKWSRKVIRVQPNVPLEKFSIPDFIR